MAQVVRGWYGHLGWKPCQRVLGAFSARIGDPYLVASVVLVGRSDVPYSDQLGTPVCAGLLLVDFYLCAGRG